MKKQSRIFLVIAASILVAILLLGYLFSDYFTLEHIQANTRYFKMFVNNHYYMSVVMYVTLFGLLLAGGMPVGIPFALIGGFLYKSIPGLIYAELGCLLGSVVSFLALKYIIIHWVKDWHDPRIDSFNAQINTYGYSYLLMLNFLSVIPMFVINFLAAMAKIRLHTIAWVSLVGCFPLNLLCVIAGRKLSSIQSFKEIFSPSIIALLVVLAAIASAPLFLKKIKGFFSV